MKQLIHETVTNIKYLYPCIAYEEDFSETELVIITETKLSKIYPIVLSVPGMKSLGEDFWGQPTFMNDQGQYFCEVDGELYYKGNSADGDPHYPVKQTIHYSFPNVDKELSEFTPCFEKVKKYAQESEHLHFLEGKVSVQFNSENILESIITCRYKFKIENFPRR